MSWREFRCPCLLFGVFSAVRVCMVSLCRLLIRNRLSLVLYGLPLAETSAVGVMPQFWGPAECRLTIQIQKPLIIML